MRSAQGTTLTITTAMLSASDLDSTDVQLTYSVVAGSSLGGFVQVRGVNATSFTQPDLAHSRVTFVHDGSEGASAGFSFTLSDGAATVAAQRFAIVVSPVNDAPVVVRNAGASVTEVRPRIGS